MGWFSPTYLCLSEYLPRYSVSFYNIWMVADIQQIFPLDDYGWQSYIYGTFWHIIFTVVFFITTGSPHSAVFAAIWHFNDFYMRTSDPLYGRFMHNGQLVRGVSNSLSIIADSFINAIFHLLEWFSLFVLGCFGR